MADIYALGQEFLRPLLPLQHPPRLLQRRHVLRLHLRVGELQPAQPLRDRRHHGQPREPLVVGRDHEPGRLRGGGRADRVLVGRLVLVPVLPLGDVAGRELPVFPGLVEAGEEALLLLRLRHVEEELEDQRALPRQVALEGRDVAAAFLPDVRRDQLVRQLLGAQHTLVDAHHQHLLVVGAVEDPDPPTLRQAARRAPQEVVVQLLGRRLLERVDLHALRVDARHDVLDRTVLAGRVHRLENQQHRPAVLGVELGLQLGEPLDAFLQQTPRLLLVQVQPARVGGVVVGKAEALAVRDPVALGQLLDVHRRPFLAATGLMLGRATPTASGRGRLPACAGGRHRPHATCSIPPPALRFPWASTAASSACRTSASRPSSTRLPRPRPPPRPTTRSAPSSPTSAACRSPTRASTSRPGSRSRPRSSPPSSRSRTSRASSAAPRRARAWATSSWAPSARSTPSSTSCAASRTPTSPTSRAPSTPCATPS